MRLRISHRTEYSYDAPISYALQRIRLTPRTARTQTVENWGIRIEGATEQLRFDDHFGNETRLLSLEGEPHAIVIVAEGEVVTHDTAGVLGPHRGIAPLWLFEKPTPLTEPGQGTARLAEDVAGADDLSRLHDLMRLIAERVEYVVGATGTATTAEEALALGRGVCQDQAQIFCAAGRALGFPARYVSGYLMMEEGATQAASHAWAEAHVPSVGWVAFDPPNRMSPDERYVRLAVGRDYRDAAPVSGIRIGSAEERLAVLITVEQ